MTGYVFRRLLIIPPALLLTNFLSFTYAHLALPLHLSRNPYGYIEYLNPPPLLPTYLEYLKGLLTFNLGKLPGGIIDLSEVLSQASKASLGLLAIAFVASLFCGVLLGMKAAKHQPPHISRWLTLVSTVGLAMPSFYIGMVFIVGSILYSINSNEQVEIPFPLQGFGWDEHMILPILVLVARPTMEIAQATANTMITEFHKQYVVTARSIGHTWRGVRWRHVFRNVLAPIVIAIGRSFRLLVGDLILVEFLFGWPGLGKLLATALAPSRLSTGGSVNFLYPPLVSGVITLLAIFFMISDFAASVSIHIIDPRLRGTVGELEVAGD